MTFDNSIYSVHHQFIQLNLSYAVQIIKKYLQGYLRDPNKIGCRKASSIHKV